MRRTSIIVCLTLFTTLALGSCASSLETGGGGATSAPKSSTTAKKAGGALLDPKKCNAIKAFQQSYLIAMRPDIATKDAAEKEKVLSGLTTSADKLKKAVPSLGAEVDLQVPYLTKLIKGEPTTPADKELIDGSKNRMNATRAQFCEKDDDKTTSSTTKAP